MNPQTPEEMLSVLRQQAEQEISRDTDAIIETGHKHFGKADFDEASAVVADKFGKRIPNFVAALRGFHQPHDMIMKLADSPYLETLAKTAPEQLSTELARLESQWYGRVRLGADPAWRDPEVRNGRVSDADWSQSGGAELSEKAWHREFDRRMAERSKKRMR